MDDVPDDQSYSMTGVDIFTMKLMLAASKREIRRNF